MLPSTTRGVSLWYALLVNASAGRLVLASTARRLPLPAFVGVTSISGRSSSSSSTSSNSRSRNSGSSSSLRAKGGTLPQRAHQRSSSFLPFSWKVQQSQRSRLPAASQHEQQRQQQQSMTLSTAAAGLDEATHEEDVALADARGGGGVGAAAAAGVEDGSGVMKVTLLSGFLGAGKTTLMRNVLRQARQERLKLAVIVNDMADVNVDAQLLSRGEGQSQPGGAGDLLGADIRSLGSEEQQRGSNSSSGGTGGGASVAMQDGCICCTLRDDLLIEVEAIAREGKYQHLIIESTGISDPAPVAEALATSASSSSGGGGDGHFSAEEGLVEGSTTGVSVSANRDTAGAATQGGGVGEEMADILGAGAAAGGGDGGGGRGVYAVDTLVTVVDSTSFLDEVRKADDLEERGLEAEEGDTRTIADLLVSQVEFANVILLNKADLTSEDNMATLEALVRKLNPAARVTRTVSSDVGLDDVLGTGEFDFEEASQAAGWLQALNEEPEGATHNHDHNHDHNDHNDHHDHNDHNDGHNHGHNHGHDHGHQHVHGEDCGEKCGETDNNQSNSGQQAAVTAPGVTQSVNRRGETFGIGSFTFRARKPFHPDRLMGFVMEHLPSVLRSKGFLWLATRHDTAGVWNQAGGSFATEYGGSWDDYEPDREDGGTIANANANAIVNDNANINANSSADARRNELVFIGLGMDESVLTSALRRCLLTEEEMAEGRDGWENMSDPFPPWEVDDGTYDDM